MRHHKLLLTILFRLIPLALSAQRTISGRITDAESSEPVAAASVFIAGTTVGITTDAAGYYQLKIPGEGAYRLVVSHVGYESVYKDIEPGKTSEVFDIAMKTTTMEEVTVSAKVRFRKHDIDLFWRTILGERPSKMIRPVNPEAVYYYFDSSTGILKVTCRVPLQIINYETGYQIYYILNYFTHDYIKNVTVWDGECRFTELEPKTFKQRNIWDKNRTYVHSVSVANFIQSLCHNALLNNGFLLVWEHKTDFLVSKTFNDPRLGIKSTTTIFETVEGTTHDRIDSQLFLFTDSVTGEKKFYIPPEMNVMLISYGKPVPKRGWADSGGWKRTGLFRTFVSTPDTIRIFTDGSYKDKIYFAPVFASDPITGLNLVLPIEYYPESNAGPSIQPAAAVEDEQPVKILSENPLADTLLRAADRFERQLSVFPQEKIHLQTDKPCYLSGERIWFRAHVVDAATHVPSFSSGSIFVELFDARDSVVSRIKTGIGNDLYSGYIDIPEDTPEGDCIIRAYTVAMRDLDEDYFFMKTVRIGDPMSRIMQVHPEFQFLSDKRIGADFRFSHIRPLAAITPESLKITINSDKPVSLQSADGKSGFSFNLASDAKQRVMLLDAMYDRNPFRQYIRIPYPDDDFDVSFYPEGGSALYGVTGRTAVKAMQRDGTEMDVSGTVYDSQGNGITLFKTDVRGMGQFMMRQEPGETYYTICINSKGQSKRFELPAAREAGYALSAAWGREHLTVNILQPESRKTGDTLCLIVHTRGMIQDVRIWENTGEPFVFRKDFFPSGVSHLLLLSKDMIPVSERLVFALNDDQANVTSKTGRDTYSARSPVEYTVHITDKTGEPLTGNFSVAVTDDHEVAADSASHILTSLLLTSDLRGNIADPGYYFRKKGQSSVYGFDMLMLTQGWRRYDTERIVKNDLMYPDTLLEMGYAVSGTVRNRKRPVDGALVSILSMHGNFSGTAYTDRNGRFYLSDGDLPDSTAFIVQATPQENNQNLELILDGGSYPERKIPVIASGVPDREVFALYADKAELQYVDEHGVHISHIPEVTITAPRIKGKDYSFFYKARDAQFVISEEDLERIPALNMKSMLYRIPNIRIEDDFVYYGQSIVPIMIFVDNLEMDNRHVLNALSASDVAQVDFLSGTVAAIFTFRRDNLSHYVISIHTKKGSFIPKEIPYIKPVMPLGFQKPAEFYAPKYDTPAQNTKPDLRTTIHWAPILTTDENGKATFSFYTADAPSTYTVVVEGVTEDGKIVYKRDKIVVEN
jgi:hypothetical protein